MEVTFAFKLDQEVTSVLGDKGIIEMCAVARGGNQYLVTLVGGKDTWFYEDRLIPASGVSTEMRSAMGA